VGRLWLRRSSIVTIKIISLVLARVTQSRSRADDVPTNGINFYLYPNFHYTGNAEHRFWPPGASHPIRLAQVKLGGCQVGIGRVAIRGHLATGVTKLITF
jgi:hypothetical protein